MINCVFEDGGKAKLRHVTCSILVFNEKRSQILLVKRAPNSFTCPNMWALPGGFVDQGEYLYEAAKREVLEETGYRIKIEKLFRIVDNPVRPKEDRANIDFVFITQADQEIGKHDDEISQVKWFNFDNLPIESDWAFDHYEDVQLYLQHQKQPYNLPIIGKIE